MQMFQDFMNFIQVVAIQNQPAGNNDSNMVIEQFRHYRPSNLKGREGPLATKEWLRELDMIFLHITCTEAQKVSCASFQLVEDARYWWESVSRNMTEEQRNDLTWERLKEMIMEQYFPQSFRDQKENEFLNLQQGGMSVVDCERKFNQLSRYTIYLVDTEPKKVRRFELGLRPEISGILACTDIITYGDVVRLAQAVSTCLNLGNPTQRTGDSSSKRKWDQINKTTSQTQFKEGVNEVDAGVVAPQKKPQCKECGKYHFNKCLLGKGVCFIFEKLGHEAVGCPTRKTRDTGRKGNTRLFVMSAKDAEENP